MRQVTRFIYRTLYAVGFWRILLRAERACGWRRHAVVLLYHHIRADNEATPPLSQVEEGVSASALNTQLAEFRRWYEPGTSAELAAALSGGRQLSDDSIIVTFDDGYRDNRTLAGPILRARQLRGLIFIATEYIESARRFWWVELNDVVRSFTAETLAAACSCGHDSLALTSADKGTDLNSDSSRRELRVRIAERLSKLSSDQRRSQLALLSKTAASSAETSLPLLKWSDIDEMTAEGFDFGAHTVTHPHLTRLQPNECSQEIEESSVCLTRRLGARPPTFAYPHGDVDDAVEQSVRAAGFDLAYAANPGAVTPGRTNPYRIPRIQLETSNPVHLEVLIVIIKLGKYLPTIAQPLLSRFFGVRFEI